MTLWTAAEAARATGGITGLWQATGVSIDTRELQPGDLFVALTAARDGHDFVADALTKGASAALVSRIPDGVDPARCLLVGNVLEGLRALGAAGRRRARRVVAVTGSVGKTGTKEMLRHALSRQGTTSAAVKSFNNHWGVPLTLARIPKDTDWAVVEVGMNAPGEIEPLARLARPDVAIVTTVGPVHLAAFGSVAAIAKEKGSIFRGLAPGGTAIINADLPVSGELMAAAQGARRILRFGAGAADYRLVRVATNAVATVVKMRRNGRALIFKLPVSGRHLAFNAVAVLAAVEALGGDVGRAALALGDWEPPEGRGRLWRIHLADSTTLMLVDESYNANPASMGAALSVLASSAPEDGVGRIGPGRRIAFLGDMLELGQKSSALHAALARHPALRAVDRVHTVGPLMRALHTALPPSKRGEWHADSGDLAARARRLLDAGDVAMVKGSLGARMGRVVDAIRNMGEARPATETD